MKDQPKHSPSPWYWDEKDALPWTDYDDAIHAPFLRNANGCPIMTGSDIRICYEADGVLMLAAPDLLEALKSILSDEMRDHKAVYEFGGFVLPDELRNQALAAIAKAEGRGE